MQHTGPLEALARGETYVKNLPGRLGDPNIILSIDPRLDPRADATIDEAGNITSVLGELTAEVHFAHSRSKFPKA